MKYLFICVMFIVKICHADYVDTLEDSARMSDRDGVLHVKKMLATRKYDGHLNAALCTAAQYSSLEMVKTLVETGADVNLMHGGETPLHKAAASDKDDALKIAKYLVSKGAEIDTSLPGGPTPLYNACSENEDLAVWFLEKGADPNVEVHCGKDIKTPIYQASLRWRTKAVKALINKGAKVNIHGDYELTPLHRAAQGNMEMARVLIDAGADVNAVDNEGNTPLHSAVFLVLPIYHADPAGVADLLLEAGADPYIRNKDGVTIFELMENSHKMWKKDKEEFREQVDLYAMIEKWETTMPIVLERAKKGYYKKKIAQEKHIESTKPKKSELGKELASTEAKKTAYKSPAVVERNESENLSRPWTWRAVLLVAIFLAGGTIFFIRRK